MYLQAVWQLDDWLLQEECHEKEVELGDLSYILGPMTSTQGPLHLDISMQLRHSCRPVYDIVRDKPLGTNSTALVECQTTVAGDSIDLAVRKRPCDLGNAAVVYCPVH
ncbi:unnamed protein product [Menidia menidia]|uniref:(Atlantic silverside) hypothetical protein n=1 Tax=Menidia menidia TaxID=238744 RepID=A0A8S4AVD0_9TELE|nr:unnamed protein product [Menidia menidia]